MLLRESVYLQSQLRNRQVHPSFVGDCCGGFSGTCNWRIWHGPRVPLRTRCLVLLPGHEVLCADEEVLDVVVASATLLITRDLWISSDTGCLASVDTRWGARMGGTAHGEECRDRVQNKMTTDAREADRYEKTETHVDLIARDHDSKQTNCQTLNSQ